ncbi:MAG: hypothetical protein JWM48_596 [Mycobacterium sp.]|nr:hypothetical protein [Mycobacterium sp.]
MQTRLQAARQARGWTQSRLLAEVQRIARTTETSIASPTALKTQLSRWENGHAVPDPVYRRLLRLVFGLDDGELGFSALRSQDDTAEDELRRRIARGDGIDRGAVALMAAQIESLRRLDMQLSTPELLEQNRATVRTLAEWLRHCVRADARPAIALVLADAAAMAGWQALNVGALSQAWDHFELAKSAAREADSKALLIHAQSEQAYVLVDLGRPDDAVEVLRRVQRELAGFACATQRAWLAAAEAEACAAAGRPVECKNALDAAAAVLPDGESDAETPYIVLDRGHLTRWRGHCLARIGDEAATRDLYVALGRFGSDHGRASASLRVDLVQALMQSGDRAEARAQAAEARRLVAQTGSVRQRRRLAALIAA